VAVLLVQHGDPMDVCFMVSSKFTTLGSFYFAGRPLSLDAHLLPMEFPEIGSIIVHVSALEQFHDALGHFVDITRSQDLAAASVANVHTIAVQHRQNEN